MRNRLLPLSVGTSLVAAAIAGTAGAATASAGQVSRLAAQPPRSVSSAPATYFDSRASAAPLHANPARSLGPALVVGGTALSQVWLFIVAPVVGGVLAAGLHRLLYREEDIRLAAEAQQPGHAAAP